MQVRVKGPRYWPVEFLADTNWQSLRLLLVTSICCSMWNFTNSVHKISSLDKGGIVYQFMYSLPSTIDRFGNFQTE